MAQTLSEIREGRTYGKGDLFFFGGCRHSPMHHGCFSSPSADEALAHINARLVAAHEAYAHNTLLCLTFGTSWVYRDARTGRVVSNCHKQPERCFTRMRLSVQEMYDTLAEEIVKTLKINPMLKIIVTVSPIRHLRDGLHENQLSKASLLLLADALQQQWPDHVYYFPAYEIVMDELRDYRFYAEDMVHLSPATLAYVWQQFADCACTAETRRLADEVEAVGRMLAHRPLQPDTEEYRHFLKQILLKIEELSKKYPYFDFSNEKMTCCTRLKPLTK